jgi:hypothetical protein
VAVLTAYLARRRIARRFYGWSLVVFFGLAFVWGIIGVRGNVPRFVVAPGLAFLATAVACEWYLHRSRCPRCGQRFAGNSFILRSVALLTHKYLSCQNCGLSEEELAGEEVIHDS